MQEDLNPPRKKWLVFLFTFLGVGIDIDVGFLGKIVVTNQRLVLKSPFDIAYGSYQFTPPQISRIFSSKILYLFYIPPLVFVLAWFLFVFLVVGTPIPIFMFVLVIILLVLTAFHMVFFKSFRIRHSIGSYPRHIYFFCFRHQSSSIVDTLTLCGFGDKLEQPR